VHDDRSAAIAPGRVLARFSPDLSAADRASLLIQAGNLEFLEEIPTGGGIQVLQTQAGSEWQTIDWLRAQPGVLSADPDYVISIQ
jgi:hypothetical protein